MLVIGLFGFAAHFLFFRETFSAELTRIEFYALRLFSGVATLSVLLLVASFTGFFFPIVIFVTLAILLLLSWIKYRRTDPPLSLRFIPYLSFCACVGFACFLVTTFTKPYQALIYSHDANVYTAAAFQLADSGKIEYTDPLVVEMTAEERSLFFERNAAFYSRFDGGVHLRDWEKGVVSFGFLPLFPAWLAFAVTFLGTTGFLAVLNMFSILSLLALYLIGRRISGPILGLFAAVVLFFFFPQFYFSRLPLSEVCAQTFFLSGLFVFVFTQNVGHQRLAAVLWGCLFLCRIELVYFMLISLTILFALHPRYKGKWHEWRPFFLILSGCALALLSWQLMTGSYLYIWGVTSKPLFRLLWSPLVHPLYDFFKANRVLGPALFLFASAGIVAALHYGLRKPYRIRSQQWLRLLVLALAVLLLFGFIGQGQNVRQVLLHASWAVIYIPRFCLILLLIGATLLLFKQVRNTNSALVLTLSICFLLPAVMLVSRPLIAHEQPLFMRRFLVIVFPLFFLLSLTGWFGFLQFMIKRAFIRKFAFALIAVSVVVPLYGQTTHLIQKPLFEGVIGQMDRLANRFPANALILIPRREAGFHVGLPLQYMAKRDTLIVPPTSPKTDLFDAFLRRQMGYDRPIYVLSTRGPEASGGLLPNHLLEHEFSEQLSFYTLPAGKVNRVAVRIRNKTMWFHGYRVFPVAVQTKSALDEKQVVAVITN